MKFAPFLIFAFSVPIAAEDFNIILAKHALQFSATAYAIDPLACLIKNNATMALNIQLPCDYLEDECWALVLLHGDWIVVAFRGTGTKIQLIVELVESMSQPKPLKAGGAVQYYFYVALQSIWKPILNTIGKLKKVYPDHKILFTGHSLGGALASIASTVFAYRHPHYANKTHLITFGQPRVGNYEYAEAHDRLVPNSWRVVHSYDLVAHLPACSTWTFTPECIPYIDDGPYHHCTEIWFPGNMTEGSLYSVCNGPPRDEDQLCSNSRFPHSYNTYDHFVYFEHNVSEYGRNQCVDPEEA